MRVGHELERGIVCEKCLQVTTKEMGYKRIQVLTPVVEDSTGRNKNIHRMNLCDMCYEEYKHLIKNWTKVAVEDSQKDCGVKSAPFYNIE